MLYKYLRTLSYRIWRKRRLFALYLAFVAISTLFWFLNKLNHEYTIELDRQLILDNTAFGLRVVHPEQYRVRYRVKGHGYALLAYRGFVFSSPLRINYQDSLRIFSILLDNHTTLTKTELSQIVTRTLPSDLQLVDIVTDSLHFIFDKQIQKRLPVYARVHYKLADQHSLVRPLAVIPDSIDITGTEKDLKEIEQIATESIDLGVLAGDVSISVPLKIPSGVVANRSEVRIKLKVEQYSEKKLVVPIRVHTTDSIHLQLIPTTVTVSCCLPISYYDSVTPQDLHFWVRPDTTHTFSRLKVEMDSVPFYLTNLRFEPMYVGYYVSQE